MTRELAATQQYTHTNLLPVRLPPRKATFHCDWPNVTQLGMLYRFREMDVYTYLCIHLYLYLYLSLSLSIYIYIYIYIYMYIYVYIYAQDDVPLRLA